MTHCDRVRSELLNKCVNVGDFNGNMYAKFMLDFDSRGRTDTRNTNNS
jgi:hypothetical protein